MAEQIVRLGSNVNLNLQNRMPIAILPSQNTGLSKLNIGSRFTGAIIPSEIEGFQQLKTIFGVLPLQTRFPIKINDFLELQLIHKGRQLQFLMTKINYKSPRNDLKKGHLKSQIDSKLHKVKLETLLPRAQYEPTNIFAKTLTQGMKTSITFLERVTIDPTQLPRNNKSKNSDHIKTLQVDKSHPSTIYSSRDIKENASIASKRGFKRIDSKKSTSSNHLPINKGVNKESNNKLFPLSKLHSHSPTNHENSGRQFKIIIKNIIPVPKLSFSGGLPTTDSGNPAIGKSITGVVIGQKSQNISIMQSHAGPLAIQNSSSLPAGTTITFQILAELKDKANPELDMIKNKSGLIIHETKEWKSLTEVIQLISEANPAIGKQALNTVIPRLDIALASKLIFFITALQGSDIRKLFGDAPIRLLNRTNPKLLSQLSDDFKQISSLADESNENEWRAFPIPILNNQKIEQIRLFLKSTKKQNPDASDAEIRFIVDVNLTQIGRLQLDGLHNSDKKTFNMIIRTEMELTKNIKKTIKGIFHQVTEISKTDGQVNFNASPDIFLNVNQNQKNICNDGLII